MLQARAKRCEHVTHPSRPSRAKCSQRLAHLRRAPLALKHQETAHTLANHFPLVARNATDILNLGVARSFQKRARLTASRPREAMDKNRGVLFWILLKHTLDVVKGNVDAPGICPCPYSSSLRTSIKTAPSVARHRSTPLLIVAPVIRSIKLMRCSSSFFKWPRKTVGPFARRRWISTSDHW